MKLRNLILISIIAVIIFLLWRYGTITNTNKNLVLCNGFPCNPKHGDTFIKNGIKYIYAIPRTGVFTENENRSPAWIIFNEQLTYL